MKLRTLALVGLLSLSSCIIHSIHPWITAEESTQQKELLGTWKKGNEGLEFLAHGEREYKVIWKEWKNEGPRTSTYIGRTARIGEHWYLNFFPAEDDFEAMKDQTSFVFLVRCHGLARLEWKDQSLKISFLDHNWFDYHSEKGTKKLPGLAYQYNQDKAYILTSSTADLKKFLRDQEENTKLFRDPGEYTKQ